MERVVVLSVDEVSVLIGLLDARWSRGAGPDPNLGRLALRYEDLLWSRLLDVPEGPDDLELAPPEAIGETELRARCAQLQRRCTDLRYRAAAAQAQSARLGGAVEVTLSDGRQLQARHEELAAAVRAALELLGSGGPLQGRPANDPDLVDVRELLATVTA